MFIATIISLIFSAFILNIGTVIAPEININAVRQNGKVLGVTEKALLNDENYSLAAIPRDVNQAIGKVADAIKLVSPAITQIGLGGALPANEDRELWPKKSLGANKIEVAAKSVTVIDAATNKPLYDLNSGEKLPIASITKLMTALVFLDNNPGWEETYEIKRDDRRVGGKIYLFPGEIVKIKDLFNLSLVGSANTATIALVRSTGLSENEFVAKMNNKASELGLMDTSFADPIGLSNFNISTAREVSIFAKKAIAHKDIRQATLKKTYNFSTLNGRKKSVESTDYLLENFPQNGIKLIGGKTGYTEAAGYCFIGNFTDKSGHEIISVILGSIGNNERFKQTRDLAEWIYENYRWAPNL